MSDTPDELNTTRVLDQMFETLRAYSETRKTTDEEIFRQRARQYADPGKTTDAPAEDAVRVLVFDVEDETYGLDVGCVQSVRPLPSITRVPNAPAFYRGLVNVRGAVVTVLDLRAFFGLTPAQRASELVVVQFGALTLGVLARAVHDVTPIPRTQINSLEVVRYTLGVYVTPRGRVMVLDDDEIRNDERLMGGNSDGA